jgi:undecaprenyl pyrophosphate phosphatase UppP
MEKEMMATIVSLGFFAAIVLSIYFIMKYKTMMQPKTYEPNLVKQKSDWQKPGIVVLGTGLGVLVVGLLKSFNQFYLHGSISIGIIVIFTGVSLIVAQQLDKKDSTVE